MSWRSSWRSGRARDLVGIGSSAALLVLAFPPADLAAAAWVALVPLLLVVRRSGPALAAGYAFGIGVVLLTAFWWWIFLPSWNGFEQTSALQSLLAVLPATGLVALYLGAFGLGAWAFMCWLPGWSVLTLPTLWVVLEFARSHLGFAAWPFGVLGYSQHEWLPVARLASVTSVYGISFLIVAVNALLAEGVAAYRAGSSDGALPRVATATFAALALFWGASFVPLEASDPASVRPLRVAIVQAPVPFNLVDTEQGVAVYRRYARLSRRAAEESPHLIVWPSSVAGGGIPGDRRLVLRLGEVARRAGAFLLVGTAGLDKMRREPGSFEGSPSNSAFLFSPRGTIVARYDKMRLLPFDEYLPLRRYVGWIPWFGSLVELDATAGSKTTAFAADGSRFGVQICWENLFPGNFRRAARDAEFMVGMTNEVHFPAGMLPQHQAMYALRAIENRTPMLRASTNGLSGVIDADGRLVAKIEGRNGRGEPEGYLLATVGLEPAGSLYRRYGDWFVASLVPLLGLLTALALARRARTRRSV